MRQAIRVTIVVVGLSLSSAVSAQPRFDVFGGGQAAYWPPEPTTRDWLVTGGFRINDWFDYVVEVAWYRRPDLLPVHDADGRLVGARGGVNHHFRAATGIRGRMTRERRITPFYQGLVGLFELSSTHPYRRLVMLRPWGRLPEAAVLQPGVGLDVAVRPGLKVRFAADLIMEFIDGHVHNGPRASIGIAAQF